MASLAARWISVVRAAIAFRCRSWILVVSVYQCVLRGFHERLPSLCACYILMVSAVMDDVSV